MAYVADENIYNQGVRAGCHVIRSRARPTRIAWIELELPGDSYRSISYIYISINIPTYTYLFPCYILTWAYVVYVIYVTIKS